MAKVEEPDPQKEYESVFGAEARKVAATPSTKDDAELAGINRALPAASLGEFVRSLAHRIADFPAVGRTALKDRVNAISLAEADDFRRDSDLFLERGRDPETQRRTALAMSRGFQTHDGEIALPNMLSNLVGR